MQRPVPGHIRKMSGQAAQAHRFGMGFVVEIGIGGDGLKHLARAGNLAVIFGNQFFLEIHEQPPMLRNQHTINHERKSEQKAINIYIGPY